MTRQDMYRQDEPVHDREVPGFKSVKLPSRFKNPKYSQIRNCGNFFAFPTPKGGVLVQTWPSGPPLKLAAKYRYSDPKR